MAEDVQALVKQLLSDDEPRREQAYFALLEREEDVVPPLIDAFYAGVTEAQGVLLLDLLGAIGGYEALNLLADVLENGEKPGWRERAALGLARNGRTDVLDTVFDWLQDGEATRRQMATLALGYVGGAEASMALVHLLHEDEVAPQAVEALFLRGDVEGLAAGV